jgi:hypothetical protein
MFNSPLALMEVARASPKVRVVSPDDDLRFATVEMRADIQQRFKHVRVP